MHPISLQATTPILELRGASSASLNALHPPPSANPTQRAICCRIFTPAALPEYPAASLRDYCSGAYTTGTKLHTGTAKAQISRFFRKLLGWTHTTPCVGFVN